MKHKNDCPLALFSELRQHFRSGKGSRASLSRLNLREWLDHWTSIKFAPSDKSATGQCDRRDLRHVSSHGTSSASDRGSARDAGFQEYSAMFSISRISSGINHDLTELSRYAP